MNGKKREIDEVLNNNLTCVMATVDTQGLPEAATVGFSHNDKYEFFIGTNTKSRKYTNILNNPSVAIVVGLEKPITIQYEGTARVVTGDELKDRLEKHFEKIPGARNYANEPGQTYIVVTPTWMRYTNIQAEPDDEVIEFTDFRDLS